MCLSPSKAEAEGWNSLDNHLIPIQLHFGPPHKLLYVDETVEPSDDLRVALLICVWSLPSPDPGCKDSFGDRGPSLDGDQQSHLESKYWPTSPVRWSSNGRIVFVSLQLHCFLPLSMQ